MILLEILHLAAVAYAAFSSFTSAINHHLSNAARAYLSAFFAHVSLILLFGYFHIRYDEKLPLVLEVFCSFNTAITAPFFLATFRAFRNQTIHDNLWFWLHSVIATALLTAHLYDLFWLNEKYSELILNLMQINVMAVGVRIGLSVLLPMNKERRSGPHYYVLILAITFFLACVIALFLERNLVVISALGSLFVLLATFYFKRNDPIRFFGLEQILGPKKYRSSAISEDMVQTFGKQIEKILSDENVLKDLELSLDTIAAKLDLSLARTSQIISRYFGESLSKLIAKQRIALAKAMLSKPDLAETSILRIAYECGFGSKSAFNRAFRSEMGETPTEFRKNLS